MVHLSTTEILVFGVLDDLFFGMLPSVLPIVFIGFSEERIFKKK